MAAGYGPSPGMTLTWRQFWHAWHHQFLRRARTEAADRNWAFWTANVAHYKEGQAAEEWRRMEAQATAQEMILLDRLAAVLPPSVRALVPVPSRSAVAGAGNGWWDRVIERYPKGSRQRRFYEAGKRAALGEPGTPSD